MSFTFRDKHDLPQYLLHVLELLAVIEKIH